MLSTVVAILALAPVLPYLDTGIIVVGCVGVLGGVYCDYRERYPLQGVMATLVAIGAILFYGVQISWADVATPVSKALIALLVVRLLTPKESRDYLQVFVLGLFILASSSLVSLDLGLGFGFLTYLVLMVFAVTLGLVLLTVFVTDKRLAMPRADLYKLIRVSLIMPVVALVLMVVFFFVLPRTRHPMWNFLNPGGTAKAGLAESVEPGNYARISSVQETAFRAEVEELAPEDLYWRVLVLNQPEENRWVRSPPPDERSRPVNTVRAVKVKVFSDPRSDRYLFALDRPAVFSGVRYQRYADSVYIAQGRLDRPFRLEMLSHVGAQLQVEGAFDESFYLTLPDRLSPRMRQAATDVLALAESREGRIQALERFFLGQQLTYAQDDLSGGIDPVDDFLFVKKRGYCEYFASAYVTLARMSGIPARLVGGYLGGEYNAFGGYYLVTEDKAHVWVEVLTDAGRWLRVDPSQWAVNAEVAINSRRPAALNPVQRMIDALNYRWVQGVLLFDFFQQLNVLMDARDTIRRLKAPSLNATYGYVLLGLVLMGFSGYLLLRFKQQSPEARLLEELRTRLRKRYGGDAISSACGLEEIAERFDNEPCRQFATIYQGAVFRDRALTPAEHAQLKELLKQI